MEEELTGVSVILGAHNYFPRIHPEFKKKNGEKDVAVLELPFYIDFAANPKIRPACMPTSHPRGAGTEITLSGWGDTEEGAEFAPDKLREVTVPIIGQKRCASLLKEVDQRISLKNSMFCGGFVQEGGKDTCQGDSGGPAVFNNNGKYDVIGVVSFGKGCGRRRTPGVYTKVTHPSIMNFINEATNFGGTTCGTKQDCSAKK